MGDTLDEIVSPGEQWVHTYTNSMLDLLFVISMFKLVKRSTVNETERMILDRDKCLQVQFRSRQFYGK